MSGLVRFLKHAFNYEEWSVFEAIAPSAIAYLRELCGQSSSSNSNSNTRRLLSPSSFELLFFSVLYCTVKQ